MLTMLQFCTHLCVMLIVLTCVHSQKHEDKSIEGKLEISEVCNMETFNATCPHNHVILVQAARYGRMSLGRCVKRDLGYLGCAADVLMVLDARCSGRRQCVLRLPEPDLYESQPCPEDTTPYLNVSYYCVKASSETDRVCSSDHRTVLSDSIGHIRSFTTEDKDISSTSCPWVIKVQQGQRINLTLFNFNRMPGKSKDSATLSATGGIQKSNGMIEDRPNWRSDVCYDYASISEHGSVVKRVTLCGGERREKPVYESRSNSIEVTLVNKVIQQKLGVFLIKYEAVSCPDPVQIPGAEVRRDGDLAVVTCADRSEVFYMTCRGNEWSGKPGNCSSALASSAKAHLNSAIDFPYGILIVVAVGVALGVLLGGLLLIFAIFYMKRRRTREVIRIRDLSHSHLHDPDVSLHSPGSGKLSTSCYFDPNTGLTSKRPTWDISMKCLPTETCGSSCKDVHHCHLPGTEIPLHPGEFITMPGSTPDCVASAGKLSMRDLSSLHRSVPNRLQSGRTCHHHHTYDFPTCL